MSNVERRLGQKGDIKAVSQRSVSVPVETMMWCAYIDCHRPTLSVSVGADQRALTIRPYTDLLLHDMGAALADGITEGDASPQEFRTPPLWGVGRTGPPYLHDGRAKTLHEAILAHGGEGEQAAATYKRLADSDRATLLGFVMSR